MAKKKKRRRTRSVWLPPWLDEVFGKPHRVISEAGGHLVSIEWEGWFLQPVGIRLIERVIAEAMTRTQLTEVIMGRLKKLSPSERVETAQASFKDPEFEADFPAVAEYMFNDRYEDGSSRKPSSLTLFVGDGHLKCVLKDPDNERALWASGENFQDLLMTLEVLLDSEDAVWRVDRRQPGQQANRKKN